jgi:hypothetical protein
VNTQTIVSQKLPERSLKVSTEGNYFWTQSHPFFKILNSILFIQTRVTKLKIRDMGQIARMADKNKTGYVIIVRPVHVNIVSLDKQ